MRWIVLALLSLASLQAEMGIKNMRAEKRGPIYREKPAPCKCSDKCIVYEPKVTRVKKNITVEEQCNQRVIQYEPVYTQVKRCRMVPEYYYETVCKFVPSYSFKPAVRLRNETQIVEYCEMEPKEISVKRKDPECSPCG